LLEREQAMEALEEMLAGVRVRGEGRVVFLGGEAGVGKTALLRALCLRHAGDAHVLWGACEPLRTPRPLAPVWDIAVAAGGGLDRVLAGAVRPHEVALALLERLRGERTSLLVIEDLHWADEATLDVVALLAARIASTRALVLASYRDDELERAGQLRHVLAELAPRQNRLELDPLSPAAIASLALPHGVDARELYSTTGGNPFFATEVLAAGGERLPQTVRDAVLARTERLPRDARRVLECVAIVPGRAEIWLLQELAGELLDQLDDCLSAGVLVAAGTSVAFRHELSRLAVEQTIPPHRHVALHRSALTALAAGGQLDAARLAHHADAAGDAEAVLAWAPRAATAAAASGAHREAAEQYARALRYADRTSPEVRAELLQRRAEECWLTADFDAAIECRQAALAIYRELGDRRGEGDSLRALSRLLFFTGRTEEGEPVARQAVRILEQEPPGHELAMAYGNISQRKMVVEDVAGALEWGTGALELARELDDAEALVYAMLNMGGAQYTAGDRAGRETLERAIELARAAGLEEYAGRAFFLLALAALRQREFAVAAQSLQDGLAYCDEHGLETWRLYLLACRARVELANGRWEEAGGSAAAVLRSRRAPVAQRWALIVLGLVRLRRGDAEAGAPLERAHSLVESTGEPEWIGLVAAARAEAAWLRGDPEGAAEVTEAALSLARRRGAVWLVDELAYWRRLGQAKGEEPAGPPRTPFALSMAGDWKAAAAAWGELGCPYEAALALAEGDEAAMRSSVERLQQLGARAPAQLVARRLRARGVRSVPRGPRPSTRENPAGLTARELEVLALLADGLRNAQIAHQLVVSERTVDHHVSAILRKLDVGSRGEAGARAIRLGLAHGP
jgi:DNA-binding CsgD family transcriptional regulator